MINFRNRDIIRLASPVFISLFAQNIIGITDTAFMGRLGEVELGGAAMATLIYFCLFTVGYGLGAGTQIIVARRYGAQLYKEIGKVMGQSILLLFFIAVLIVTICFVSGRAFFHAVLNSTNVADVASDYWQYRVWGFLVAFICTAMRAFYVGIRRTKVLTYNAVVMAVVNIVLDYSLIFGHFGLPAMGVKGAAIASVIAEVSSLIFYILYTNKAVDMKYFDLKIQHLMQIDTALMKRTLSLSIYLMMQSFFSIVVWSAFFFMIEKLGERPLAIATIIRGVYVFLYIPITSYGTAVNTSVSSLIGEGHKEEVGRYIRKVGWLSLGTMLLLSLIICCMPHTVLRIFTNESGLIQDATPALYVICIALCISSYGNMYFAAVSATGATKMALYIELSTILGYLIYTFVMTYGLKAPVHLCFTVEALYYVVVGVLSYRFIASKRWQSDKWANV